MTTQEIGGPDEEPLVHGPIRVDPGAAIATLDGERMELTPKEFALLMLFVSNPGRLLRRKYIGAIVWGGDAPGRTIDVHVARLRNRLPAGAVETVIRLGYRFVLQPC